MSPTSRQTSHRIRIGVSALIAALVASATALTLTGCYSLGYGAPRALPKFERIAGPLKVVASVAVWADVAKAVGGKHVTVKAIITSPTQDPHSYQATTRDQLAVNRADLTVRNGGYYDQFFSFLEQASPNQRRYMQADLTMVSPAYADDASPVKLNDHIWYDLKSVRYAAGELTYRINLGLANEADRKEVRANERAYARAIGRLEKLQGEVRALSTGKTAILTESFAAYLLHNLGIKDATPQDFKNAVEQEGDASPQTMRELKQQLTGHKVALLVVNEQTESNQTNQLVAWAKVGKVPVLRLSELLPTGETYLTWMRANLLKFEAALK